MNNFDRKETLLRLNQWKERHDKLHRLLEEMKPALGCLANSPLFEALWVNFEIYTTTLAELLGGDIYPDDWLTWYWSENNMGKKGMLAGYNGKLKPIKNLSDLCRLIEEERRRLNVGES